jgi:hypothetical protein
MALTENKQIDRVEVVGNGIVQVRESTTILKDGEFYARTFHRWSFAPESDISAMPANVQAIAQAAWTPEVIAAYKTQLEANKLGVSA